MGLLLNRAKASTSTTGTGAVTLGGAVAPFQAWSAAGATSGNWYDYLIEDGVNWEMGVGLYNGTTITRGGPGVDPWFTSSTGSLLALTGAATIACVANKDTLAAGAPFMPPLASSFSLMSSDATQLVLANDTRGGLSLDINGLSASAARIAYRTLTTPASAWDMTAQLEFYISSTTASVIGITCLNSSNTRNNTVGIFNNIGLAVGRYSNTNTYSTAPFTGGGVAGMKTTWFRIRYTGTTLEYYWSANGSLWNLVLSETPATYLTAAGGSVDRVGIKLLVARTTGSPILVSCPYFTLTGPGV